MPFSLQYKPLILSEESVSKSQILPRNIYKITTYQYVDGTTKTLAGTKTSLVFVIGITSDKKLTCIKISNIKPEKFFQWLKPIFKKGLKDTDFDIEQKLGQLLILCDRQGSKIFNQFVKTNPIYSKEPSAYRTYNISGIKQIQEIRIKPDILKSYY
jgi:hypothetical protein